MKLKNNLSEEAFANSYREQGYNEYQIRELKRMLGSNSGLEKLMTPEINSAHMAMLNMFSETDCYIQGAFFSDDGALDVDHLEHEFEMLERYNNSGYSFR